jgi:hypothetical protein
MINAFGKSHRLYFGKSPHSAIREKNRWQSFYFVMEIVFTPFYCFKFFNHETTNHFPNAKAAFPVDAFPFCIALQL